MYAESTSRENDSDTTTGQGTALRDFWTLVEPHYPVMLACARRYTRHDTASADDVVQDALERAFKGWHNFTVDVGSEAEACVRGWLMRVVQSAFVTRYHREVRAHRYAEHKVDYTLTMHGMLDESDAIREPARASVGDECAIALQQISPERAEVIRRVDMLGQTYRQVATELGIPVGTVMSRLKRGRDELRAELADFAAEEYGYANTGIRYGRAAQPAGKKRRSSSQARV